MKKIFFILLIAISSLFAKADLKLVEEYMQVSGTQEVILALPKQIKDGFTKTFKSKPIDIDIETSFDLNRTIEHFKLELSKEFDDELLKNIIAYYRSEIGKKFKDSIYFNEDNQTDFFEYLGENPPSYQRLNILNAFVDKVELTPVALHMIGELIGSIGAGLVVSTNNNKFVQNISQQIRDRIFLASLHIYHDFSDQELKSIMSYYYTSTGRTEQKIVSKVFKSLILESLTYITKQTQIQKK